MAILRLLASGVQSAVFGQRCSVSVDLVCLSLAAPRPGRSASSPMADGPGQRTSWFRQAAAARATRKMTAVAIGSKSSDLPTGWRRYCRISSPTPEIRRGLLAGRVS